MTLCVPDADDAVVGEPRFPYSVDYIVTSLCNLQCKVCWGTEMPKFQRLSIDRRKEIVDAIVAENVKQLIFTGGEPLLDCTLSEMMGYAHGKIKTYLFTNTSLLDRLKDDLLPYTDKVSFSLDGANEEMNSIARKPGHYPAVLYAMDLVRNKYPDVKVQVTTVVTQVNRNSLEDIGELLEAESQGMEGFRWKLNFYQNIGKFDEMFRLPYDEFKATCEDILRKFAGRLEVRHSMPEHDHGYLFIFPDASLYTIVGKEYVKLGNILQKGSYDMEVVEKIRQTIVKRDTEIPLQAELQKVIA